MIKLGPEIIGKKVRITYGRHHAPPGTICTVLSYDATRQRGGIVNVRAPGYGRGLHWAENVEGYNE